MSRGREAAEVYFGDPAPVRARLPGRFRDPTPAPAAPPTPAPRGSKAPATEWASRSWTALERTPVEGGIDFRVPAGTKVGGTAWLWGPEGAREVDVEAVAPYPHRFTQGDTDAGLAVRVQATDGDWLLLSSHPWPAQRWSTRGPTPDEATFARARVDEALVAGLKWHERDRLWRHRSGAGRVPKVIEGPEGTLLLVSWELPSPCMPRGTTELWLEGERIGAIPLPDVVPLVDGDGDGWPELGVYPGGGARSVWHVDGRTLISCCGS